MLVVIDTNIFISALLKPMSNPGIIVENVFNNNLTLALSNTQFNEIKNTFSYPKIRKALKFTPDELALHISELKTLGVTIDIAEVNITIESRDEDDNYLLATLLASKATHLITGDKDLLCLADNYPVITPADFVEKYLPF
ncbi:MAG: uncharacterized protein QG673_256 [Pseudomonadota bacterium]|nr:uncharacterized protein [Pseudomonadota bacterium]